MPEGTAAQVSGTCFVVMGFGRKTDFETGRTLDLDKTYRSIIKPAVKEAGLACVRADEIVHSGLIDVPMYEQLLNADVVVADLSTSNKNAYYELGVRHALKPYTTIIICEDGVKMFPFDVNHVAVRQYHHLGEFIDIEEAERFRKVLTDAIIEIRGKKPPQSDSPVYTFLNDLTPPALAKAIRGVAEAAAKSAPEAVGDGGAAESPVQTRNRLRNFWDGGAAAPDAETHSALMQQVNKAMKASNFVTAKALLSTIRDMMKAADPNRPEDPYVVQQLALATYKSKLPTAKDALEEAREILKTLNPETSNDTETLGLWGAVHKRLWDETHEGAHLDEAVRSYERGFNLRNDYYNGINFAYLLNVRAAHSTELAEKNSAEAAALRAAAIADFVQAQRVRREVLSICEKWLADNPPPDEEKASQEAKTAYVENKYWVVATQAEAYLGTGQAEKAEQAYQEAYALQPPKDWMVPSTKEQREKLEELLADSPLKYVEAGGGLNV